MFTSSAAFFASLLGLMVTGLYAVINLFGFTQTLFDKDVSPLFRERLACAWADLKWSITWDAKGVLSVIKGVVAFVARGLASVLAALFIGSLLGLALVGAVTAAPVAVAYFLGCAVYAGAELSFEAISERCVGLVDASRERLEALGIR